MKRKTDGKKWSWRWLLPAGGGVLLVWALLPLLMNGISGVGVWVPALMALAGIVWGLRRPSQKTERKGPKKVTIVLIALICLVAVMATLFSVLMIVSAVTPPAEDATVIVLGSKINGDRPSRMLRSRLDAAADWLEAHPESNCVVSGGLGEGETYTEAEVMKNYLVGDRGIDPERIACEDKSTNTRENTAFSLAIIEEKGWNRDVAMATQVFHQYRAAANARTAGATSVGGVACFTPAHLMLNYWVRECAAICRLWLLGH